MPLSTFSLQPPFGIKGIRVLLDSVKLRMEGGRGAFMRSYDMMMHRSGGDDGERKGEWKNNAVVGSWMDGWMNVRRVQRDQTAESWVPRR